MSDQQQPAAQRPVLRVVRGEATEEEVAALIAVLSARAAAATAAERPAPRRSEWAGHERRMRRPVHPSPNGWRASAFPR
ncbi:MAG: acyl-CoA carboxylase subunit epsilon [Actinomycetota bacterium]|nr:acyl-CoA carboxylase subunit epsilon [Actinomycetota bacterium]